MFNIFKKKELIRRPISVELFCKICIATDLKKTITELQTEINQFLIGKETVSTQHSITIDTDNKNYIVFYQIDFVCETNLLQRFTESIGSGKFDLLVVTKNDKKGKKWYHL